jgi:hypothetical protein
VVALDRLATQLGKSVRCVVRVIGKVLFSTAKPLRHHREGSAFYGPSRIHVAEDLRAWH